MDKRVYQYKAFGLNIDSTFFCPEFAPSLHDRADIKISKGNVPTDLKNPTTKTPWFQVAPNEFLLSIKGLGRFYINSGKSILVSTDPQVSEDQMRLFLVGRSMGIILHQRGYFVLHANAIEVNGKAVVFMAPSGIGKSTTAGGFYARGYRVLTDDVCAITMKNDRVMVYPGYPQIKLWTDSAEKLNKDITKLRKLSALHNKYALNIKRDFSLEPIPLGQIYVLECGPSDKFFLKPLRGMQKFFSLRTNTYGPKFFAPLGLSERHLEYCSHVSNSIKISKITRPQNGFLLDELIDFIEADFLGNNDSIPTNSAATKENHLGTK